MTKSASKPLTLRQRQALDAMIELHQDTGAHVGPTALAAKLGIGRSYALEIVRSLVAKGYAEATRVTGSYSNYRPLGETNDAQILTAAIRVLRRKGRLELANSLRDIAEGAK